MRQRQAIILFAKRERERDRAAAMASTSNAALRWADMVDDEPITVPLQFTLPAAVAPPLRINRLIVKSLDTMVQKVIMFRAADTIGWLQEQLARVFGIPVEHQRLIMSKWVLEGADKTFEKCGLHDESCININDTRTIKLYISTPTHGVIDFEVPPSISVGVLKQRLGCRTGVPVDWQWLAWSARIL